MPPFIKEKFTQMSQIVRWIFIRDTISFIRFFRRLTSKLMFTKFGEFYSPKKQNEQNTIKN